METLTAVASMLKYDPITHGEIKPAFNPKLNTQRNGRTAVKFLRFLRRCGKWRWSGQSSYVEVKAWRLSRRMPTE